MDQTQQQPTAKQQISELLRTGSNFIVVTPPNPTIDQAAAALGLTNLLRKVNKNAQGVALGKMPREIDFLPSYTLASKPEAQRDFVIELDTSKTEADKLKYTTEGKKLKVYITPFNGNFSKDDVSFDYGDYHVDAVVVLGATDIKKLAEQFGEDRELIDKAKVVTINNSAATQASGALSWNEDASSISEMVMSMSEALQSGILDKEISTVLLTGIIFATDHFSGPNTTPKVMTMAAQLMAAGADQSHIMKQLEKSKAQAQAKSEPKPKAKKPASEPKPEAEKKDSKPKDDGPIEMKPTEESSLKEHDPASLGISATPDETTKDKSKPEPQQPQPPAKPEPPKPQPSEAKESEHKPELKVEPPHPQADEGKKDGNDKPLSPFMAHQLGSDVQHPGSNAPEPQQPPQPPTQPQQQPSPSPAPNPPAQPPQATPAPQPPTQPQQPPQPPQSQQPESNSNDVDAARRAVEAAAQSTGDTHQQLQSHYSANNQPQQPQVPQPNQPQSQQPQPMQPNNQPLQPPQNPA